MQPVRCQFMVRWVALTALALPAFAQTPPALPELPPAVALPQLPPTSSTGALPVVSGVAVAPAPSNLPPVALPAGPATPLAKPPSSAPGSSAMPAVAASAPPVRSESAMPLPASQLVAPSPSKQAAIGSFLNGLTQKADASVEPAAEQPKSYSYGNSNLSILFLPNQIDRMKTALRTYESTAHESKPTVFVAPTLTITVAEQKIDEPADYPVFYLASIAYDGPSEWSLWISGHKITSRHNDTDVTVVSVSPDSATFSWSPTYAAAIKRRHAANVFAPLDKVKNKLAHEQRIEQNPENDKITFTLKQNQAFTVGYFRLFEGFVPSPKVEPWTAANSAQVAAVEGGAASQSLGASEGAAKPPALPQASTAQRPSMP